MTKMDCKKEENLLMCNCTYPCSKKGICCECVAYHRSARQIPACFFSKEAEQSYDRSFEFFAELVRKDKI